MVKIKKKIDGNFVPDKSGSPQYASSDDGID